MLWNYGFTQRVQNQSSLSRQQGLHKLTPRWGHHHCDPKICLWSLQFATECVTLSLFIVQSLALQRESFRPRKKWDSERHSCLDKALCECLWQDPQATCLYFNQLNPPDESALVLRYKDLLCTWNVHVHRTQCCKRLESAVGRFQTNNSMIFKRKGSLHGINQKKMKLYWNGFLKVQSAR